LKCVIAGTLPPCFVKSSHLCQVRSPVVLNYKSKKANLDTIERVRTTVGGGGARHTLPVAHPFDQPHRVHPATGAVQRQVSALQCTKGRSTAEQGKARHQHHPGCGAVLKQRQGWFTREFTWGTWGAGARFGVEKRPLIVDGLDNVDTWLLTSHLPLPPTMSKVCTRSLGGCAGVLGARRHQPPPPITGGFRSIYAIFFYWISVISSLRAFRISKKILNRSIITEMAYINVQWHCQGC
jgi:hypothetical protein